MNTFSLNDYLFGPVNVKFCAYFYFLSIIHFSVMAVMLLSLAYTMTLGSKKMDSKLTMTIIMGALAYGVLYFQSRLLHSMCVQKDVNRDKLKN
jgi:hypothetical protein